MVGSGGNELLVFNGDTVSVLEDENIPETGCTAM